MERHSLDPASFTLVEALRDDPFYVAISSEHSDPDAKRRRLAEYFSYSLEEARLFGRCMHLEDPRVGAAAWLLPIKDEQRREASIRKREFLEQCLGRPARIRCDEMVLWMSEQTPPLLESAWYLSIVGIAPDAQGRGLGRRLLLPTLAEADRAGAVCYAETFSARNLRFYERLGFRTSARFLEPTTQSEYSLMVRYQPNEENALRLVEHKPASVR